MTEEMQKRIEAIKAGKVPDGYKKTVVGIVPSEWHEKRLSDLLKFQNGVNAEKEKFNSGIKMISVMDILDELPIVYDAIRGQVDIDKKALNNYSVTYGDILFQRSSETVEDAGKSNVYLDRDKTATYSGFVIRGKKIADYDPVYLNELLKTTGVRQQIIKYAAGSQHINVSQDSLARVSVCLASEKEQKRIAEILLKWHKVIELHENLIEKLELRKKALIQKLFTPTKNWNERTFKSLYNKAGEGGTPSTSISDYYDGGDIPFIKIEHLYHKYIEKVDSYITKKGLESSGAWLLPKNCLLFSNGATIGEASINKIPVATKQGILGIVPADDIDVEFLYYYFGTSHFLSLVRSITTKGTMPIVYLKDLDTLKIKVPSYDIQRKIAQHISLFDNEITLYKETLKSLIRQHKAMQQLLLTGIVRV